MEVDAKALLQSFDIFYDHVVILFFNGKLLYMGFGCGEWAHFMGESHRHCPSTLEVPNEENGKEGLERDVGMPDIGIVMDKGTSSRAGDKEATLQGLGPNKGTQSMDMEHQSLVLTVRGKIHWIAVILMMLLIKIGIM